MTILLKDHLKTAQHYISLVQQGTDAEIAYQVTFGHQVDTTEYRHELLGIHNRIEADLRTLLDSRTVESLSDPSKWLHRFDTPYGRKKLVSLTKKHDWILELASENDPLPVFYEVGELTKENMLTFIDLLQR